MALKPVVFPAVYERVSPHRTDDEIYRDMNTRFDSPATEARTTNSTPLAEPPVDLQPRPSKTIGKDLPRRGKTGRPRAGSTPPCPQHDWYTIGRAKTAGKMRQRCRLCKREETVLESAAPKRAYRKKKVASEGQDGK